MTDLTRRPRSPDDAEVERDILSGRKFSLAEAIGRSAGGLLKGVSPATRKRQAEAVIEGLLEGHLRDAEGALANVLLREARGSAALLSSYDDSTAALIVLVEGVLGSAARLRRFVTQVDAEWGRLYLERPHFDREEGPADDDDPYTVDGVRDQLADLLEGLRDR